MEEKENKSPIVNPPLFPLAVAVTSKYMLERMGPAALGAAVSVSPLLVGTLLAAGAFCIGKLFSNDNSTHGDGKILESLQRTSLDVRIEDDGQTTTTVSTTTETSKTVKVDDPVVVENHQGTTVVHINNLTINLNAEMVQQLNLNPKEVINQLTEQISKSLILDKSVSSVSSV